MYCNKCGAENADDAAFCQKCGKRFENLAEEETVVAGERSLERTDDEAVVFSIRPTLLFVKSGYVLAVIGGLLLAVLLGLVGALVTYPWWSSAAVVVLGLSMLLIPAYYHVRQKMIRYTLTDSKVEIDEGLLNKTTRNVPLRIIQDVTVSANALQRILGVGDIMIENANENDQTIILRNINSPKDYAEKLLKQMRLLNK